MKLQNICETRCASIKVEEENATAPWTVMPNSDGCAESI